MRIGIGYDAHRLVEGRPLVLGGVVIPFEKGLMGHSDADVLVHAIMDALLGAAALGDIGRHFPDTDKEYAGISSMKLLERVSALLRAEGYSLVNIDSIIIAQRPKLVSYLDGMVKNIVGCLGTDCRNINVKATTEEGMGFTGAGEGIEAKAVCLLQ